MSQIRIDGVDYPRCQAVHEGRKAQCEREEGHDWQHTATVGHYNPNRPPGPIPGFDNAMIAWETPVWPPAWVGWA